MAYELSSPKSEFLSNVATILLKVFQHGTKITGISVVLSACPIACLVGIGVFAVSTIAGEVCCMVKSNENMKEVAKEAYKNSNTITYD